MGATGRKKREKLSSMPGWKNQTGCVLVSIRKRRDSCQQERMGPYLGVQTVWDLEQKEEKRERWVMVFLPEDMERLHCSIVPLILAGVSV